MPVGSGLISHEGARFWADADNFAMVDLTSAGVARYKRVGMDRTHVGGPMYVLLFLLLGR